MNLAMRGSLLGFCLVTTIVGCAQLDTTGEETNDDSDFQNVPNVPTAEVCTGTLKCFAQIQVDGNGPLVSSDASPAGLTPAKLQAAYGLDVSKDTVATIAVIDAYGYSAAASDLAKYRSQFGLPPCTVANGCFQKVNQSGKTSPLPAKPPANDDWTVETALDLDMASAACPTCKLLLVEADDDSGDGLYVANDTAASLGATVVSNSWGGVEGGTEKTLESHFTHTGVGYFASSGDAGFDEGEQGPSYPATSAHVTAVGGTTLVTSSSSRGWSEKAWADGGSNCSKTIYAAELPAVDQRVQQAVRLRRLGGRRSRTPASAVYNKANGGFIVVGGTSASSPFVAGVMALYGLGTQGPGYAYSHKTDFFDVKSGTNGTCGNVLCKAQAGWDGPSGIGTPDGHDL